jgi:Glycosyl hydrolase family 26
MMGVLAPLASAAVSGDPGRASRPPGPLVPKQGALLGAWADNVGHWVDDATAEAAVVRLEGQIGRKLAVDHHYYAWTDSFPTALEQWDVANGRIPLISWGGTALGPILNGDYDQMIRARADAVRAFSSSVFIRWAWEMNGNWSPYDGTHSNHPGQTDGPALYVQAWRHIHDIFQQEGVKNAVWVWCPNASDVPAQSWNHWTNYYPGDAYVDWVAVDAYNWGNTQSWSSWTDLSPMIGGVYGDYAARKPIMIAETASTERGGNKATWLQTVQSSLKSKFPSVAALVYFDQAKEVDWQVDSSASSLSAFKALANDRYFNA